MTRKVGSRNPPYFCTGKMDMTLNEKVDAVEELFKELDIAISHFQQWSGLYCVNGCGKCCLKPDITATILEFLPLAYHAFKERHADSLYEKLQGKENELCIILDPTRPHGMCGDYNNRGLICRIFGFSARRDKYSRPEIITCKIIKTEQAENYTRSMNEIAEGAGSIPIAEDYYRRLMLIDTELGRDLYPINVAVKKALEVVMHYYAYREVRD
jgi:Fe-S-cluster containining protein